MHPLRVCAAIDEQWIALVLPRIALPLVVHWGPACSMCVPIVVGVGMSRDVSGTEQRASFAPTNVAINASFPGITAAID